MRRGGSSAVRGNRGLSWASGPRARNSTRVLPDYPHCGKVRDTLGLPAVLDLENIAKRYARDTVLAPNPTLDTQIALTAWGRIETLSTYSESRIVRFVDLLHGRYDHDWTLDPNECRLGS